VAAIPISVFHSDANDRHMLRFCFAKTDETLIAAAEKLNAV
jgi:methionine aminotransferase